jgi:hypothetical protein
MPDRSPADPELRTLAHAVRLLDPLDEDSRGRVLMYLCARYAIDARGITAPTPAPEQEAQPCPTSS